MRHRLAGECVAGVPARRGRGGNLPDSLSGVSQRRGGRALRGHGLRGAELRRGYVIVGSLIILARRDDLFVRRGKVLVGIVSWGLFDFSRRIVSRRCRRRGPRIMETGFWRVGGMISVLYWRRAATVVI